MASDVVMTPVADWEMQSMFAGIEDLIIFHKYADRRRTHTYERYNGLIRFLNHCGTIYLRKREEGSYESDGRGDGIWEVRCDMILFVLIVPSTPMMDKTGGKDRVFTEEQKQQLIDAIVFTHML